MATTRKCIGSAKFGIEAHEAPPEDFPAQPSQKDGLGRMCRDHWKAYVQGLARAAKARKDGGAGDFPRGAGDEATTRAAAVATAAARDRTGSSKTLARQKQERVDAENAARSADENLGIGQSLSTGRLFQAARLPETLAEVGSDEGQAALETAAKSAQTARRAKPARGRKTEGELIVDAVDAALGRLAEVRKEASIT